MTSCECGHMTYNHGRITYPTYREPCDVCLNCGRTNPGPGRTCCLTPKRCPCPTFTKEHDMNDDLRDAATRAAVWGVIAAAAKERQDQAKTELAQLQPGDTIAGRVNGQLIGKATMTRGRTKLAVTDERKFIDWVALNHPTELVQSVNPAFMKSLEARGKELGTVIDSLGEAVPGVEIVEGAPYVSIRKEKDATAIVAQLLSVGRISLDGIQTKELES